MATPPVPRRLLVQSRKIQCRTQHRRDESQWRIGDEGRAVDGMRVELSTWALAVSKIRQPDGVSFQHEDVVADSGVAAGCSHGAGKPRVDHLEVVGPDKEEGPLWVSVALVHAADDHPAAVIDPAGERKLAGDAITAVDRRNASRRQDRWRDGKVKAVGPHRLLCILGELADVMGMMDHQASAPSARCVCLADFAHHFEPSVEVKAITSEPLRYENAGDAGGEQRVNSFTRYCPRLFRRGSAIPDARSPLIRARISSCVFTVLSLLSLAIAPAFTPSMHRKNLALVTASCSRTHVYKNSATSDMIRRTRWLGSRLMAMQAGGSPRH